MPNVWNVCLAEEILFPASVCQARDHKNKRGWATLTRQPNEADSFALNPLMERSDHAACLTEVACGWHEKSMMPDVQAVQMPILGHKTASRSGLSVYSAACWATHSWGTGKEEGKIEDAVNKKIKQRTRPHKITCTNNCGHTPRDWLTPKTAVPSPHPEAPSDHRVRQRGEPLSRWLQSVNCI